MQLDSRPTLDLPHLPLAPRKILLVDDDDVFRDTLGQILRLKGFEVEQAANVASALRLIHERTFDALISDLHMPAPGDGLTVVSAMRHSHPQAITLLMSAFPEMNEASRAILKQADEVLVKPMKIDALVETITGRLSRGVAPPLPIESLASILERQVESTIEEWLGSLYLDPLVPLVPLDDNLRCAHLAQLFRDLIVRLRHPLPLGHRARISPCAAAHGIRRREQGYTAAMLVEESRLLQLSIFQLLQDNLATIDFSTLLPGIMAIADEIDSQLAQQTAGYISESLTECRLDHRELPA